MSLLRYNKTKSHRTTMSEGILAYRLLKSANLLEQHKELAKGTTRAGFTNTHGHWETLVYKSEL